MGPFQCYVRGASTRVVIELESFRDWLVVFFVVIDKLVWYYQHVWVWIRSFFVLLLLCDFVSGVFVSGLTSRVFCRVLNGITRLDAYSLKFEKGELLERCIEETMCWRKCVLMSNPWTSHCLMLSSSRYHVVHVAWNRCSYRCMFVGIVPFSFVCLKIVALMARDSLCSKVSMKSYSSSASTRHTKTSGMLAVTTSVEYVIHRMNCALYEEWTEARPLLRRCIRQGSVFFVDLRDLVTYLIDLWPSIRPFIRCTGIPHVKDNVDSVSVASFHFLHFFASFHFFFVLRMLFNYFVLQIRGSE